MIDVCTKDKIIKTVEEETERIEYGKLFIEITIDKHRPLNIQIETRRSVRLLDKQKQ